MNRIFKALVVMDKIILLKEPLETSKYEYVNHKSFDIVDIFFIVCLWPFMSLFYIPSKIIGRKIVFFDELELGDEVTVEERQ